MRTRVTREEEEEMVAEIEQREEKDAIKTGNAQNKDEKKENNKCWIPFITGR